MSNPTVLISGSKLITADGVLGIEDVETRVFNMHIISGATAGVVILRNGDATSDTAYINETGTANTGKTFDYGEKGHLFSDGCFVDVDANVTSVLISYSQ